MPETVREWLDSLGMGQYADAIESNGIDMRSLPLLEDADLREMHVLLGHRKVLLAAIEALSATQTVPAEQPTTQDTSSGERRQLTVLFCDLVGYTELTSRTDPEILQEIVRSYEDTCAAAITRYEGYVYQRLGDGIVAFFGYPLAHEGEAERAIRSGLDIVDALSALEIPEIDRLSVRIGIATGMVVVASVEKGAVGETMNLAARLQAVAPVNTIVVSERVRQLAGGSFEYEDLGEQTLKGIKQPTHAFRVVRVSSVASRFDAATGESLTPLVGRDLELGLLMDRWARSQEGEGQVVLLSGEPGIGKSRILRALRERLETDGARSLRFQCSPYYVNSAFWPSISNFERALRFTRDETPEAKLDKLESLISGYYRCPLSDVRFIAGMLSIPCEERYGKLSLTPQRFKDEIQRALVDMTEAAARKQPSVLLFEDTHWADPTTLEVLDLLIDRVKGIPLLVVLTHRPEFNNRWSGHGHVSALDLSKLTRAQSRTMVAKLAGGKALPDDLLEQILAKTDGVPLFVEELTKSILESGELTDAGGRYEYAADARRVTVPATLRDSLMARLDRHAGVKEIAQIGAVIGREFSYELISAVSPLTTQRLEEDLTQLTAAGLAFRRGTPPDAIYTFKHMLLQDAAYDSLLKSRRQELHAKIANVIVERFPEITESEPEVHAHHLSAAGETRTAIPLWQRAGELSLKRMALAEAISHLNKGIELIETVPKSAERDASELSLRITLGIAWTWLKGWAAHEVWTSFYPGLALAESLQRNDAMLPILWGLSRVVRTAGRVAESLQWCEELLEKGNATGDQYLILAGHTAYCISCFYHGDLSDTLKYAEQAQALYTEPSSRDLVSELTNDPNTVVSILASQATWMLGYPDRGLTLFDEAVSHARQLNRAIDLGWALSVGADLFDMRCEPDKLRECAEECERLGRENSLPLLFDYLAPVELGIALIRRSEHAEGIALIRKGLAVWDATGGKIRSPYLRSVVGEVMVSIGEVADGLKLLDEQIEQVERPGWEERVDYAEILRLKGSALMSKGDPDDAEDCYRKSLEVAREQKAKSWELRTSTSYARLMQSQGRNREALDLLKPVYDWFTEGFDTKDLKDAKALVEELQGNPARA